MLTDRIPRKSIPAWITLGLGLLFTILASIQVKQRLENDAASAFSFDCDQLTLKIQERLGAFELILRGGAALMAASDEVDRHEWRAYAETLRSQQNLPGLQGVGFSVVVPKDGLDAHIARLRNEGFPDYAVFPPGERDLYTSTLYIEPFVGRNRDALGFDMFAEPIRRAAMETARDTDEAALTGKVSLLTTERDSEVVTGVLMYVPVYRKGAPKNTYDERREALVGWTYSPYRMNDLIEGILRPWERREDRTIDLQIYDELEAKPDALLFDSQASHAPAPDSPFYQQRLIDFHGHSWRLVFD